MEQVLADQLAVRHEARIGLMYGLAAYITWGMFPLYFKQVAHVAAVQILCHRIAWSVVVVGALLTASGRWGEVWGALQRRRVVMTLMGSTLLIAMNWFLFIYATTRGHVLDASMGYYMNPLVSVVLGMAFLRERLRAGQAVALGLAAGGVAYLTWSIGYFPALAVGLAMSFGLYGLLRKTVSAGPLVGLCVETMLLLPAAAAMIAWAGARGPGYSAGTWGLLVAAGPLTAAPLLWFASAARRLRLATMGFIQYLTPTAHFLLAVLLYGEPFTRAHAITFGLIWGAVAIYSIDSVRGLRGR